MHPLLLSALAAAAATVEISREVPRDPGGWLALSETGAGWMLTRSADGAPVAWVHGLGEPRAVRADPRGPRRIAAGDVHVLSSERAVWRLSADASEVALSRRDLRTGATDIQRLDARPGAVLAWAGDLDGDGAVDLILEDAGVTTLWLSAAAGPGQVVAPIAQTRRPAA